MAAFRLQGDMGTAKAGGIIQSIGLARIGVMSVPDRPGIASAVLNALGEQCINVEFIVQSIDLKNRSHIILCVNQEMLEFVANYASEDSAVYVNIETNNEYIEMLEVYLREHYQLEDITYGNINADLLEGINNQSGAVVLMPFIENQPQLTVRAGVEEFYQQQWNQKFLEITESNRISLQTFKGSFRLSNVNLPTALCPILGQRGFCDNPDPLIDTRIFTYGWEIFEIK